MNCKPGDLAYTLYSPKRTFVVEVLSVYKDKEFDGRMTTQGVWRQPCWLVRSLGAPIRHTGKSAAHQIVPMPDAWLRPLRDSGDDATDETLEWLPVPHKETA